MYLLALSLIRNQDLNLPHAKANTDTWNRILFAMYALVAAIGFLLLVIAAMRYTLAGGNADKVSDAKRMIIYTLVGMVVISLAGGIIEAIVKL